MIEFLKDGSNYFTIYGIIVAVLYPTWFFVINWIAKRDNDPINWTDGEEFALMSVVFPVIGAAFLLFWPLIIPLALLAGIFSGVFHLNKARIENKEKKSDAVSGW